MDVKRTGCTAACTCQRPTTTKPGKQPRIQKNSWKEQKEGRSPTKPKAPVEPTANTSANKGNLRLSNSFKSALCTKMMTSDKEADEFFSASMKVAELSDTSDEEPLKE